MLITFLKRACAYLEGKGIIDIKSASPEISWSSTLISGHVPYGSTIIMGSALRLIPGRILGLITNVLPLPQLVSYICIDLSL